MVNQKDSKAKAGTKELLSLAVHKSMRPKDEKRKPKSISRISVSPAQIIHREVVIKKGKGKKLSDIPNVEHQIDKHKHSDAVIINAHRLLYGTAGKAHSAKQNLREFSGFAFDATITKDGLKKKLEAKPINPLRDLCDLFCLDRTGAKEDVVERIFEFLEKPHATDVEPKTSRKHSRSPSPSRSRSRSRSPVKKSKKEDESDKEASGDEKKKKKSKKTKKTKKSKEEEKKEKRPLSSFMKYSQEVRPQVRKDHPKLSITEVASKIGEMWRGLSQKDKDQYKSS